MTAILQKKKNDAAGQGWAVRSPLRGPSPGALDHAVRLIDRICCLAGTLTILDEVDEDGSLRSALSQRDTPALYDWLISSLSYQGVSDQVACQYMERHGRPTWRDLANKFAAGTPCPKLQSYWQFHGCRYDKTSRTCAEPDHIGRCPLPTHELRNGRLNQTAYALFLFIRDAIGSDLVGWIDQRLQTASNPSGSKRLARMREALIGPLRHVYGVSDKVLSMALASLLLSAPREWSLWLEVGGSMIAIDTLVHNHLHRTGILHRFANEHVYGAACYQPGGCAEIIETVARRIDARAFNPAFPRIFPRFVQHAIWRYCSQDGLDICNGNRIDDRQQCHNEHCQLYSICDRRCLHVSQ